MQKSDEHKAGEKESLLNEYQSRHLLVSIQHIDKLLSDIETILDESTSNSPFPKYRDDTTLAQRKVVRDYILRIRKRLVHLLTNLDISHPGPGISAVHGIRTILSFISVTTDEFRPNSLRGYGAVAEAVQPQLNGISNELGSIVGELNSYLERGIGQDYESRLAKLEAAGGDTGTIKVIENVVSKYGLTEFRSTISLILERLEDERFEIAFFGRVSAGKSTLLNHILQTDYLPVGVNPITAVPTRLRFGPDPKIDVQFANSKPAVYGIEKLTEFVTEQNNAGNAKNVTRITVELPSPRLRDGLVFVDTPGLGSLAGNGAAETIAYLPRCDLGVVLIDAGSTLTVEDLSTVQALLEAAVPAVVLLSKADLLPPSEQANALKYIEDNIRSNLGVELPVYAVSAIGAAGNLADKWFEDEILPMYGRHRELTRQSIRRKVGSLRERVETSLKLKLTRNPNDDSVDAETVYETESSLQKTAGSFEATSRSCRQELDEIPKLADAIYAAAAADIVDQWPANDAETGVGSTFERAATRVIADKAARIYTLLIELSRSLKQRLAIAAKALDAGHTQADDDYDDRIREMPQFDLGTIEIKLRLPLLRILGSSFAKYRVEKALKSRIGSVLDEALMSYRHILESWMAAAIKEQQIQFDSSANFYRSRIESLNDARRVSAQEEAEILRDIQMLESMGKIP
jgi:GTP-binding protein EngB required for normal cell division